jgi:hypothetical protein
VHPVVLLETFVDPKRFLGIVYKAANWIYAGNTKGLANCALTISRMAVMYEDRFNLVKI